MYGKVAANAMTINVNSLLGVTSHLVRLPTASHLPLSPRKREVSGGLAAAKQPVVTSLKERGHYPLLAPPLAKQRGEGKGLDAG
jgi:hypothetical protein